MRQNFIKTSYAGTNMMSLLNYLNKSDDTLDSLDKKRTESMNLFISTYFGYSDF